MRLRFYGKKTCVTCQKAKAFLEEHQIAFEELPIETHPPSKVELERLVNETDVKASLNSRSAIYKAQNLGKNVPDKQAAIALMLQDPNLIKRPVLINEQGQMMQGFELDQLKAFLKS
ncbi:arsenate reductase family protein [Vampirovibrio chlorellavorus]|uniref:arsenate reductase family protein n=1 Tax=Vampirovibrio chlorellavorus TaxID=758823 RepID=UPI0026EDEC91|nr:Spx/MgsR family RNA polymerase-binding regulatory protein [Vampirovibrio chlorellavorus]